MSPRRSRPLGAAALLLVALLPLTTACASTLSATEGPKSFTTVSTEESTARLAQLETSVGRLLAEEAGLGIPADRASGGAHATTGVVTVRPAIFSALAERAARGQRAAQAARAAESTPMLELVQNSANGLSEVHDLVRQAMAASAEAPEGSAQSSTPAGANPKVFYTTEAGVAGGEYVSTISDTNAAGDSVTIRTSASFTQTMCPDTEGRVSGDILTSAAVTFTPAGGAPSRSVLRLDIETAALVGNDAHTRSLMARVDAEFRSGQPFEDDADGDWVSEPTKVQTEDNAFDFTFLKDGANGDGTVVADQQLDGALSAQVDDLTEQIAPMLTRAAEDYWRSGACVIADVYPENSTPMPATHQTIAVEAKSKVDGEIIDTGTVEFVGVTGASTVEPAGSFDLGKIFAFTASQEPGAADPVFEVTTRRGIGRTPGPITVFGDSWAFTGTYGGGNYTGYTCHGIKGPWTLSVYVPEINEGWSTQMTFDDALSSGYDDAGTGNGPWAVPDARYWFTPEGSGYVFHADPFDPSFPVSRTAVPECSAAPEGDG